MGWEPKRYDPPGSKRDDEQDEDEHRCPKCSWAEWEICVWMIVAIAVFWVGMSIAIHGWTH